MLLNLNASPHLAAHIPVSRHSFGFNRNEPTNPIFVRAAVTAGDNQMDVRMPFHAGTKSVRDYKYAHASRRGEIASPLLHGFSGGLGNQVEPLE